MARTVAGDADHLFVVERYLPDLTLERLTGGELAAGQAARGMGRPGRIRHQDTIWIPADETVISTFLAPSSEALDEALRAGGVPAHRIVEAVRYVPGDLSTATDSKELDHG
jgi:hypothetical protein